MRRRSIARFSVAPVIAAALVAALAWPAAAAATPKEKVTLCHAPPGNPVEQHTIVVSESAARAHFRNHAMDAPGACPSCDDGDPTTIDRRNPDTDACVHTPVPCGAGAGCVVRVPSDVATLQEAIDTVDDGGVVLLAPGTYTESFQIDDKRVHLVGDWGGGAGSAQFVVPPSTGIRSLASARGIANYGRGGGGSLQNLVLTGGDAAVLGFSTAGPIAELAINNVTMQSNLYGIIAGSSQSLSLENVSILDSGLTGYLALCSGDQSIISTLIHNAGQMGVYVKACSATPSSVTIHGSFIGGNAKGGALFIGDGGNLTVVIATSYLYQNTVFGLWFQNVTGTPGYVFDTVVTDTHVGDLCGGQACFQGVGDGVIAVSSSIIVEASAVLNAARAGVLLDLSSDVQFFDSVINGDRFGFVSQHGSDWTADPATLIEGGEQDILTDGDLPVPEPPPVPEQ